MHNRRMDMINDQAKCLDLINIVTEMNSSLDELRSTLETVEESVNLLS